MKTLLLRLALVLAALLVAATGQTRPLPYCTDVCCTGTPDPATPCLGAGNIVAQCGPPYSYICPY
jgi:hypothetical protein